MSEPQTYIFPFNKCDTCFHDTPVVAWDFNGVSILAEDSFQTTH